MDDFFGFKLFSCYPLPGACVTLLCDIRWLACPAVLPACRIYTYAIWFPGMYSAAAVVVDYPIFVSLIFCRVPCLVRTCFRCLFSAFWKYAYIIGNRREKTFPPTPTPMNIISNSCRRIGWCGFGTDFRRQCLSCVLFCSCTQGTRDQRVCMICSHYIPFDIVLCSD